MILKKHIAFANTKINTLVADPKKTIKTLLRQVPDPKVYIGSCKTGSFLISDVLGYVRSVHLQNSGIDIQKNTRPRPTTLLISVTQETDYNELERLNHIFQSELDNYHIVIVIDPQEYQSKRMPPSAFSRLVPYRNNDSYFDHKDDQQQDPQPDIEILLDESIIGLLHHMAFDADSQTLHFSNHFQTHIETLATDCAESHILITFEVPQSMATLCMDEYEAICLSLNCTGKLDLYNVDLTSIPKKLLFQCVVSELAEPNRVMGLIRSGQLALYSDSTTYDLEINDYTIDLALSGTPTVEKNAEGRYALKTLPPPKTVCVATPLDPESVNKLVNWLCEDTTRRCGVHRGDSIGLSGNSTFAAPRPYDTITIQEAVLNRLTEYDQGCLFETNGNDTSDNPILIVDPGDIALCRMHIINAPQKRFMITESAYDMLTEYGHFGPIRHVSIVTGMDPLASEILKESPMVGLYLSATVLVRVAWLQTTGLSLKEAIQQGICNGLPNQPQTQPANGIASYFYAEKRVWAFDPTKDIPALSALQTIRTASALRVACVTPVSGQDSVALAHALDAGGCFKVPFWVGNFGTLPPEPILDQPITSICERMPKSFIIGHPQKKMIEAVYGDLLRLSPYSLSGKQRYYPNIRLLIGESGTGKDEIARLSGSLYPQSHMIISDVFNPLFVDQYTDQISRVPQDGCIRIFNFQEINLTEDHIEAFERVAVAAIQCPNVYLLVTANNYASRAPLSLTLETLCTVTQVEPLGDQDKVNAVEHYLMGDTSRIKLVNQAIAMTKLKDKINFRLIRSVCEAVANAETSEEQHAYLNTLFEIRLPKKKKPRQPIHVGVPAITLPAPILPKSTPKPSTDAPTPQRVSKPDILGVTASNTEKPNQPLQNAPVPLSPSPGPAYRSPEEAVKDTSGLSNGHELTMLAWWLSVIIALLAMLMDRYLYPYKTFDSGKKTTIDVSSFFHDHPADPAPLFHPPYQIVTGSEPLNCRYLTALPEQQMVVYAPQRGSFITKAAPVDLGRVTGTNWSRFFKELPSPKSVEWHSGGHLSGISNLSTLLLKSDIGEIPESVAKGTTPFPFANKLLQAFNLLREKNPQPDIDVFDREVQMIRAFYDHYFQYDLNANHFYPTPHDDTWLDHFLTYRIGTCAHFSDFAQMVLAGANPGIPVVSVSLAPCGGTDTHRGLLANVDGTVRYWDVTIDKKAPMTHHSVQTPKTPSPFKETPVPKQVTPAVQHSEIDKTEAIEDSVSPSKTPSSFEETPIPKQVTPAVHHSKMDSTTTHEWLSYILTIFFAISPAIPALVLYYFARAKRDMDNLEYDASERDYKIPRHNEWDIGISYSNSYRFTLFGTSWYHKVLSGTPTVYIPEKKRRIGMLVPHKPGPKDWARWLMVTHATQERAINTMSSARLAELRLSIPKFLQLCAAQGIDYKAICTDELAQSIRRLRITPHVTPKEIHVRPWTVEGYPEWGRFSARDATEIPRKLTLFLEDVIRRARTMPLDAICFIDETDPSLKMSLSGLALFTDDDRFAEDLYLNRNVTWGYREYDKENRLCREASTLYLLLQQSVYNHQDRKVVNERLPFIRLSPQDTGFQTYDGSGSLTKSVSTAFAATQAGLLETLTLDGCQLASDTGYYHYKEGITPEGSLLLEKHLKGDITREECLLLIKHHREGITLEASLLKVADISDLAILEKHGYAFHQGYRVFKNGHLVIASSPLHSALGVLCNDYFDGLPFFKMNTIMATYAVGALWINSLGQYIDYNYFNSQYMLAIPIIVNIPIFLLWGLDLFLGALEDSGLFPETTAKKDILQRMIHAGLPVTTDTGYRMYDDTGTRIVNRPSLSSAYFTAPILINAGYPLLKNTYREVIDPKDGKHHVLSCIAERGPSYNGFVLVYYTAKAYLRYMVGLDQESVEA